MRPHAAARRVVAADGGMMAEPFPCSYVACNDAYIPRCTSAYGNVLIISGHGHV